MNTWTTDDVLRLGENFDRSPKQTIILERHDQRILY
jgi:hypothetical protein